MAEDDSEAAHSENRATEQNAARACIAAADWDVRYSRKGLIPVLSPESAPDIVDRVAAALAALKIPFERISQEREADLRTQLRITSKGRSDFVAALQDTAHAVRSKSTEAMLLKAKRIFLPGETSPPLG